MNLKKLVQDNWKGVVVGLAVGAASAYGGPLAGGIVGKLLPVGLSHVSDKPITDIVNHENPLRKDPVPYTSDEKEHAAILDAIKKLQPTTCPRQTISGVEKDWGIKGKIPREVRG